MNKQLKAIVIGVLAAVSAAGAQATLSSKDLFAAGDGLITTDSTSNLEWLDLSSTAGLSINQILGGQGGWVNQGFRYASFGEFKGFLYSAGLTESSPGSYVAPTNGAMFGSAADGKSFLDMIGAVTLSFPGANGGYLQSASSGYYYGVRFNLGDSFGIYTVDAVDSTPTFVKSNTFGSYLVRVAAPVPEPETYAMLALGLGMIGWTVRRRKIEKA